MFVNLLGYKPSKVKELSDFILVNPVEAKDLILIAFIKHSV